MSLLLAYKSPATPNEIRDQRNLLIPQGRNCRPGLLITYESAGPKRLLTSPSLRQLRWLTGFSWRKCAPNCASTIHPRRSAASAPARLNPLLTIQAANSAYRGRRARTAKGRAEAMSMGDLPVLSALRTRMQWHQERQRVLAENVANSDTP